MTLTATNSPHAPRVYGPYSQAVSDGKLVFTAGQLPLDPATMEIVPGGIHEQAYAEAFGDHKPARSTVAVAALPRGARVEIDAVAIT